MIVTTLFVCWGAAISTGFAVLAAHAFGPGMPAVYNSNRRVTPSITNGQATLTLLMFLHPECPCSHASVEELNRLMAQCKGRLSAEVFVYQPSTRPDTWSHGSMWQTAEQIPGVTVKADRDALMAKSLGARTSGQVFLYNADGQLRFSGGITESRGHAGDNDGSDAVIDQVLGRENVIEKTPVFGCALYSQTSDSGGVR